MFIPYWCMFGRENSVPWELLSQCPEVWTIHSEWIHNAVSYGEEMSVTCDRLCERGTVLYGKWRHMALRTQAVLWARDAGEGSWLLLFSHFTFNELTGIELWWTNVIFCFVFVLLHNLSTASDWTLQSTSTWIFSALLIISENELVYFEMDMRIPFSWWRRWKLPA